MQTTTPKPTVKPEDKAVNAPGGNPPQIGGSVISKGGHKRPIEGK